MELIKKEMRTSVVKMVRQVQVTLDRDMNVPDSRPDMEKLIQSKGEIQLDEIEVMQDRVRIKGALHYKGLYHTAEAGPLLSSLSGTFDLEEYINADGLTDQDEVKVTAELDDLNVVMIHSRKLGIRALLTFRAVVNEVRKVEGAVRVEDESVEQRFSEADLTQLVFHKRDTCRVKGEMTLAASKPNVHQLIWEETALRDSEVRLLAGKVQIRGELSVFFLYLGEEEHVPVQHVEWEMPFTAEVDCPECREDMVGHVQVNPGFCQLEVRPDEDGEERILVLEAILNLDLKGYEEEKFTFLEDLYSTEKETLPVFAPFSYENLIIKNNAKTKVQQRVSFPDIKGKILQLIHVDGSVKIDEIEKREEGIFVEGVILAEMLLITEDDRNPLYGATKILPFSYLVEARNLGKEDSYELEAGLEQIHGMMADGDEVEVKAMVSLDLIAFSKKEGKVMTEVEERPYDYETMKQIPGVAVYIAQREEPVWNVAKTYASTVESICQMNQMETDVLKAGQKVLVVKKVKEVL